MRLVFNRLHRVIGKKASTLLETLVAMFMIAIIGVMMAGGLMTSLRMYTRATEIQGRSAGAAAAMYTPDSHSDDECLSSNTGYAEFFRSAGLIEPITSQSYTILEKTADGNDEEATVFYYYGGGE